MKICFNLSDCWPKVRVRLDLSIKRRPLNGRSLKVRLSSLSRCFRLPVVSDIDRSQRGVDHRRRDAARVVGRRAGRRLEAQPEVDAHHLDVRDDRLSRRPRRLLPRR